MAETGAQGMTSSPKRTLGLMGITIHAMTLIAPGAFVWLIFPLQVSIASRGIWPGVILALAAAFLTSLGFSSLAARYPDAGNYSAYHFILRVFKDEAAFQGKGGLRWLKLLAGWAAHLFYWVYPGVMIAFMTTLVDYLLRQFGYQPTVFGRVLLAASLTGFVGFLGLRGIRGSMSSSILLNVVQIVIVALFSILAIAFRVINPLKLEPQGWLYANPLDVVMPEGFLPLMLQAAVAIFLVIGFEAVVSLGVAAANPRRDIPRGTILALLIQGLLAYSVQYFAFGLAFPSAQAGAQLPELAKILNSTAPLGSLAVLIGDTLMAGNGYTLMIVVAASVMTAALAASLTAINTAVRSTFAMSMDPDVPELLSLLPEQFATPYYAVLILALFSGCIGVIGTLGGLPALLGITLAANLGAFLLYGMICAITAVIEFKNLGLAGLGKCLLAALGVLINLGLAAVIIWSAATTGIVAQGAQIALALALAWLLFSVVYYILRPKPQARG